MTKHTPQTNEALFHELAARELARRQLLPFVLRMVPAYEAGWVHHEICRKLEKFLEDVVAKRSPRLMIFMPPRVGKSLLASEMFPAWGLGRYPGLEFINTSYGASLAEGFSRSIRRLIREDEAYRVLFPNIRIDEDTQAIMRWLVQSRENEQAAWRMGGGFRATGVGGALTGSGAHVLTIDDPVKNAEEANSETIREATWNWYATTARTRLLPGGGVLVIQTRWHDDDLSGRLIEMMKADPSADQFEVVSYPAIAEFDEPHRRAGEALHPARYDERAYAQIRASVGPTVWNALYQQNPVPDDGIYFKNNDIQYYTTPPPIASLSIYVAWDLAISQRESADPSCGVVVGFDADFNVYVLDRYYGRFGAEEIVQQMINCQKKWSPIMHWAEKEKVQMALGPFIEHAMEREGIRDFYIEPVPPGRRDKEARARVLQGLTQRHKVFFPRTAEWTPSMVGEMLRFPRGKHDDQVDALAYAVLNINTVSTPDSAPRDAQPKSWRDNLWRHIRGSRPTGHMAS